MTHLSSPRCVSTTGKKASTLCRVSAFSWVVRVAVLSVHGDTVRTRHRFPTDTPRSVAVNPRRRENLSPARKYNEMCERMVVGSKKYTRGYTGYVRLWARYLHAPHLFQTKLAQRACPCVMFSLSLPPFPPLSRFPSGDILIQMKTIYSDRDYSRRCFPSRVN